MDLSRTARLVFFVAAAIVVAFLAIAIIGLVGTIISWIIKIAVFIVIVYAVFWIARSSLSNRKPKSKGV